MKFENEKILVKELKKYNEKAFDYFVSKYQKLVISYVYTILNSNEESWNISQEVFISVFRNIDKFRGDSSLKTWLLKIARNYTINKIRYLKVRKTGKHNSIDAIQDKFPNFEIDHKDDPFKNLEKKEIKDRIKSGIDELTSEDSDIIILRYINELSYEEIADITGFNIGTVKSKLYRAKKRLKTIFEKKGL